MKGLLFLLITFFVSAAAAEVKSYTQELLVRTLNEIQQDASPNSFYQSCKENVEDIKIANCGEKSKRVLSEYLISVYQLNKLRTQVGQYAQRRDIRFHPLRRLAVSRVSQMLSCMRRISDGVIYTCNPAKDSHCKAGVIAYNYRAKDRDVQLCPMYFNYSTKSAGGIILHELSHECGSHDLQYLFQDEKTVARPVQDEGGIVRTIFYNGRGPAVNADNYRYWVAHGFCLPGYDCK